MRSAIERAGKYLRDKAIEPVSGNQEMLAVWSKPQVNNSGKPLQAKLGGAGLGLVALLSIEKFHPGFTPLSDLRKLGRFIIYMQKDDGMSYNIIFPFNLYRRIHIYTVFKHPVFFDTLLQIFCRPFDRSLNTLCLSGFCFSFRNGTR